MGEKMSNGNIPHHTETVRVAEKPQIKNATRAPFVSEKGEQPLFCINGGRLPKGVFSSFEIAAEASKIFTKSNKEKK